MSRRLMFGWVPVLLWMLLIFMASSDAQSFQHSWRILGPCLHWIFPRSSPETLEAIVFFLRKCGHVTEYAILAALLWNAMSKPWFKLAPWSWRESGWTLVIVFAYAISDEVHQVFVPTRQGAAADVLIDTAGGALGLLLIWAIYAWAFHGRNHT